MYDLHRSIRECLEWAEIDPKKRNIHDEIRQRIETGDIETASLLVEKWNVYEDYLQHEINRLNN